MVNPDGALGCELIGERDRLKSLHEVARLKYATEAERTALPFFAMIQACSE
jgi:hypothetical protein